MIASRFNRREMLTMAAGLGVTSLQAQAPASAGVIEGQAESVKAGRAVFESGGNAVDAAVTAALVAAVVAPNSCGVGGYGGHMMVAQGAKVHAIDFNSAAPAAAKPDMFPVDSSGRVVDSINSLGWKAAGVPGTLAGLQMALDRFGTIKFPAAIEPAIRLARGGFNVSAGFANAIRTQRPKLAKDPASANLYWPDGEPPKAGTLWRNGDLAALLETLAQRGRVDSFYRGDIAAKIAAAFLANGGLVTQADLAAYQAREVESFSFDWNNYTICTPIPTAGGATVVQALSLLKKLGWDRWAVSDPRIGRARLEVLRLCWDDRLKYLADPTMAHVPIMRLLDDKNVTDLAMKVETALRDGKPAPALTDGRPAGGTVHFSAADAKGMMVALTMTHGEAFGAKVTVPGLGLTLGHGMSRFDPRPNHPNAPGPGKRPLHNMCPTIVMKDSRPVVALGGHGGRKIPNAVFEVLAQLVGRQAASTDAIASPRLHTEGGLRVELEQAWPAEDAARIEKAGYTVARAGSAVVSAVWRDGDGGFRGASR